MWQLSAYQEKLIKFKDNALSYQAENVQKDVFFLIAGLESNSERPIVALSEE